jgi:hypothetical protein
MATYDEPCRWCGKEATTKMLFGGDVYLCDAHQKVIIDLLYWLDSIFVDHDESQCGPVVYGPTNLDFFYRLALPKLQKLGHFLITLYPGEMIEIKTQTTRKTTIVDKTGEA